MMEKQNTGYITILPFMLELGLSGNDLIVYAIIHGFSQDGKSCFYGGIKYLMKATNLSREGICTVLQRLLSKGLIVKKETQSIKFSSRGEEIEKKTAGNAHYCMYWTSISQNQNCESQSENLTGNDSDNSKDEPSPVRNSDPYPVRNSDSQPVRNSDSIININNKFNNLSLLKKQNMEKAEKEKTVSPEKNIVAKKEEIDSDRETEIQSCLDKIFGSNLIFSKDFVPKILEICQKNKINPQEYISWSYELLQKKNVQNVTSYFYRQILSESNLMTFCFEQDKKNKKPDKPEGEKAQNVPEIKCSVCGKSHSFYSDCPECGLLYQDRNNESRISLIKWQYSLPAETKKALENEKKEIMKNAMSQKNFTNLNLVLSSVYKKYGYEAYEK